MKTEVLVSQTRRRVPAFSDGAISIQPIEKGGSDRRFYRVRCSPQSLILVRYKTEREENRHYVAVAEFLTGHGIRAPRIYFHDQAEGLIWIEDLGETDLFSSRNESWAVRRPLYQSAIAEVAKLHEIPESDWSAVEMPPEFNAALYRWEQGYFLENCLGRYFKMPASKVKELASLPALNEIAEHLASLPRQLVHRDFQSQNIVIREGNAHLIDFQGMRPGIAEYDLASLLFDPYVRLKSEERTELFCHYFGERRLGNKEEHLRILQLAAMQRLMQALGAYGFLGLVKENLSFLAHIPPALVSLREILGGIRGLEPLGAAIAYFTGDDLCR